MPENFGSHKVTKRRRRDADEGMDMRFGRPPCSDGRTAAVERSPGCTNKRRENAPQAHVYQGDQHKYLVSFRLQTRGAWGFWVFRIRGSILRLDRVVCLPYTASGEEFASNAARRHRPASVALGGRGLNSRQINHLQQSASETHYRRQSPNAGPADFVGRG